VVLGSVGEVGSEREVGGRPSADRGQGAAIFECECSKRGAVVGFETVGGLFVGGLRSADGGQDVAVFRRVCSERGAVVGFETVGGLRTAVRELPVSGGSHGIGTSIFG
jgi:hypothetical protein